MAPNPVPPRTIPTLFRDFLVGKQRALMTTKCTLKFGRGQELKPLFLLIYNMFHALSLTFWTIPQI